MKGEGRGTEIDPPPEKTTLKKPSLIRVKEVCKCNKKDVFLCVVYK